MEAYFAQTFDQSYPIYVDLRKFTSIYVNLRQICVEIMSTYVIVRLFMSTDSQDDGPNMEKQEDK